MHIYSHISGNRIDWKASNIDLVGVKATCIISIVSLCVNRFILIKHVSLAYYQCEKIDPRDHPGIFGDASLQSDNNTYNIRNTDSSYKINNTFNIRNTDTSSNTPRRIPSSSYDSSGDDSVDSADNGG